MKIYNSPFSFKGLFAGLLVFLIFNWIVMLLFPSPSSVNSANYSFKQDFADVGAILAIILGILTYRYYQKKQRGKSQQGELVESTENQDSKYMLAKEKERNPCQALQYLVSEAKKTLELLQRLNKEIYRRISERDFDPPSGLKGRDLGLCASALKTHLVVTMGRMFDPDSRAISFKTVEWFQDLEVKSRIVRISKEEVVRKILNDRNTWTAHLDSDMKGNVTRDEICSSNLLELLNELENVWTAYFLWLNKNGEN